ncbi:hypothetical protein ACPV4E_18910, partial [Vibrio alfacsensis]
MPQWFTELQHYIMANHQEWSSSVLFITIASFFAWIAWRVIHSRLSILVEKTPFHWDDLLLEALKTPISILIPDYHRLSASLSNLSGIGGAFIDASN